MRKKIFLLCFFGIFLSVSIIGFKFIKNSKKKIIYAIHSMTPIEKKELEETIKEFSKENPDVLVELKEYKRSYSALKNGINSPDKPIDLFLLPYPIVPIFAKTDLIIPMTKYHGIEKMEKDSSWEAFAYPHISTPVILLYNKEFLKNSRKKLPKSHEEFQNILQDLFDAGVQYPFVVDTYIYEYLNDPELKNFILKVLTKTDIAFYNKLFEKNLMAKTSDIGEENRYEAFLNRKTAFITSSLKGIRYIENRDSSLDFNSIPVPEEECDQLLVYNRYVIGKNSKNPDIAFRLIEFLNNQNNF